MNLSSELTACPFCKGDGSISDDGYYGCMSCDIWLDTEELWNTRTQPDLTPIIEGLKVAKETITILQNHAGVAAIGARSPTAQITTAIKSLQTIQGEQG